NNQHEIDEITTKDQSDDDINTPNVAEDKSQDDLKDDLKEKQQQIDNSLDSTDNEKEVASQALAKEKEKALAAIDQAQTN
ncbi:DUF1542 domain-containing protein, partial [Staphylococcus sp. EG-SA-21]|uniref:DUF1542 domain-containing protein n=1 Tax=Staphylococcus sp. EG-SA-21 TaxID=2767496 RepID=UPI00197F9141